MVLERMKMGHTKAFYHRRWAYFWVTCKINLCCRYRFMFYVKYMCICPSGKQVIAMNTHLNPFLYRKTRICRGISIFSSPEPFGSQGELIVYPCSVVRRRCRPQCSNVFCANQSQTSHETSLRIGNQSMYKWSRTRGHMAKIAVMPIYGKNLKKSSYVASVTLAQLSLYNS